MSSITFAFIHLDYVMLPFYIFSGLIFAIVIYSVDSVLITIAVHFIYNLFFIFCPMYISSIYSLRLLWQFCSASRRRIFFVRVYF
jgi:membrane protease YdiL (CAAX protease family)